MDAEFIQYILDHPIISIGAIILLLGSIQIWTMFSKWVEKTIKDEFIAKAIIVLGLISLMILFSAICLKLVD